VPECVVDGLEIVEIQTQHGSLPAALGLFEHAFDMIAQLHAVGQPRQRVVMGQERDLLLRISFLGHVRVDGDRTAGTQQRPSHFDDAPVLKLVLDGHHIGLGD
jgi:hypothetical protein